MWAVRGARGDRLRERGYRCRSASRPWATQRPFCIQGDYTLAVANLLTADELGKITGSVLAKLRPLARIQRETVIRAILYDDYRARRSHGFGSRTSFAAVVRRDGVM